MSQYCRPGYDACVQALCQPLTSGCGVPCETIYTASGSACVGACYNYQADPECVEPYMGSFLGCCSGCWTSATFGDCGNACLGSLEGSRDVCLQSSSPTPTEVLGPGPGGPGAQVVTARGRFDLSEIQAIYRSSDWDYTLQENVLQLTFDLQGGPVSGLFTWRYTTSTSWSYDGGESGWRTCDDSGEGTFTGTYAPDTRTLRGDATGMAEGSCRGSLGDTDSWSEAWSGTWSAELDEGGNIRGAFVTTEPADATPGRTPFEASLGAPLPTPVPTGTAIVEPSPTRYVAEIGPFGEEDDERYTGPIAEYAAAEQRENQPGYEGPRTARITEYMGLLVEIRTDEENRPYMEFLDGMRVYLNEQGLPTEPVPSDRDSPFVEYGVDAEAVSDYAEEVVEDLDSSVESGGEVVVGSAEEPEWSEARQELKETLESRLITESEDVPVEEVRALQADVALMALEAQLDAITDELKPALDRLDAERELTDRELLDKLLEIQNRIDAISSELGAVRHAEVSDWIDEYAEEIKARLPGVGPYLNYHIRTWKLTNLDDMQIYGPGAMTWLSPEAPADYKTVDAKKRDFEEQTIRLLDDYIRQRRVEYGPDDREVESALELMRFLGWASHMTSTGGGGAVDQAAGFVERFDTYRQYRDAVVNDVAWEEEHQPPPGWGLWAQ